MKKFIINENQRGLLFNDGKFSGLLSTGKHWLKKSQQVEIVEIYECLGSERCELETLLQNTDIADHTVTVEVKDQQIALHFINGNFDSVIHPGKYAYWKGINQHEFKLIDTSDPETTKLVPNYILDQLSEDLCKRIEVTETKKGRLYFNKQLVKLLEPGVYYYWNNLTDVAAYMVDTRLLTMSITGQEIMTQDKVNLRINFICNYRIKDYIKIVTEIDDYEEKIHLVAQLALREYIGRQTLDEILANKEDMTKKIFMAMKAKEDELYIEIVDAGIKDIVIPGEIRNIMNTILVAEKKAQANVITRREEVASTRSLLNTAKLMDENKTLYRLKELEHVERICDHVGNINLSNNEDMLSQLVGLIHSNQHD